MTKDIPFVGRKNELKSLIDLTQKRSSSLVVIRGRRRIGKSRLVKEFAKNYRFLSFSGLPPTKKTTEQTQRDIFAEQLANKLNLPRLQSTDWSQLFSFLARETQEGPLVILFDEISWMGSKDDAFLGKLKNAWDTEFKNNPELILILCGSVSAWIEENILRSTGFVGRLSLVLDLTELTLPECNQFLKEVGFRGDFREKFKLLSVTGGIPRYLEEIKPDRLADENIKDLCFKKQGVLFREFKEIFQDIFARRSKIYEEIVEGLVEGDKEFSEIFTHLERSKTGRVSGYMNDLVLSGFVKRDYTWNVKDGKESILSRYRLSDNYLRFYLKYIVKNKNKIENSRFEKSPLSILAGFEAIMGLQFENLVLNNRDFIWEKLHIYPADIVSDNPYFQRAQLRKMGCQIDYLIQTRTNVLYACEIKFSQNQIDTEVIKEMKKKLEAFYLPKGFSLMPVLIHVNGVSDSLIDQQYFSHIVNFSELLS
jgi:AAA+ ATPase superfamily predicted ATPase